MLTALSLTGMYSDFRSGLLGSSVSVKIVELYSMEAYEYWKLYFNMNYVPLSIEFDPLKRKRGYCVREEAATQNKMHQYI